MDKITMTTPLVEMDGDEMTRVLWKIIKDELLLPYIDLKTEVLHPLIYFAVISLKAFYKQILDGTTTAEWDTKTKSFIKSNSEEARTGYSFFVEHIEELVFEKNELTLPELTNVLASNFGRGTAVTPAAPSIDASDLSQMSSDQLVNLLQNLLADNKVTASAATTAIANKDGEYVRQLLINGVPKFGNDNDEIDGVDETLYLSDGNLRDDELCEILRNIK